MARDLLRIRFEPSIRARRKHYSSAAAFASRIGRKQMNAIAEGFAPRLLREKLYSNIALSERLFNDGIAVDKAVRRTGLRSLLGPGKDVICGGHKNWVDTLLHEVEVFGKGHVRSCFVTGIEPKAATLEGIQFLIESGVVTVPLQWNPNPGSALEGHRAPTSEWYHDLVLKTYALLRKNGFTHEDFYRCAGEETIINYLYEADGDLLPWERQIYPEPKAA
ncbi:MAG: hypothetical protein LBF61_09055 [Azoarcus sp.]|nr:hypothetical protein [Azoarcus sp.]